MSLSQYSYIQIFASSTPTLLISAFPYESKHHSLVFVMPNVDKLNDCKYQTAGLQLQMVPYINAIPSHMLNSRSKLKRKHPYFPIRVKVLLCNLVITFPDSFQFFFDCLSTANTSAVYQHRQVIQPKAVNARYSQSSFCR